MYFHTIIVGGGPAGLACAAALASKGKETLLLERKSRIGPKICAGGITWSGAAQHIPDYLIEKKFHEQHLVSSLQNTTIGAARPIVFTIDREKMGQWMARRAQKAGAIIKTGEQVVKIDEKQVKTRARSYKYDYLIGADGSSSLVRRYIGLPVTKIGVGIQYCLPGSFPEMEWHLDPCLFKTGYCWIFPHHDKTSVGAYACRQDIKPARLKAGLHHWMDRQNLKRQNLRPEAALINFDYRGWRFGKRFLVGDAAGLASGITGEGIYSAILSGENAARCITSKAQSTPGLDNLINKQQLHARLLKLVGRNRLTLKIMPELLILALRMRLLNYQALELGCQSSIKYTGPRV